MRGEVIAMDGYILRNRQEQLTLPADAADIKLFAIPKPFVTPDLILLYTFSDK